MSDFVSVPKLWPGETVVCVASGPSLTPEDLDVVRGKARVIVVNSSYQMAPWADCLYACDGVWWRNHRGVPSFAGLKYGLGPSVARVADVGRLQNTGREGLELHPSGLRNGSNSGYQAINLAVHLGAARIILLGYDMQLGPNGKRHHHADHSWDRKDPPFYLFLSAFPTLVQPLKAAGIAVVNATRSTALTCFPRVTLERAFSVAVAA